MSQPVAHFLLRWLLDTVDRADVLVPRNGVIVFDEDKLKAKGALEFPMTLLVECVGVCLNLIAGGISRCGRAYRV